MEPGLITHCSRLSQKSERKDFLSNMIDKVEAGEVSHEELTAHTSTLVYVQSLISSMATGRNSDTRLHFPILS